MRVYIPTQNKKNAACYILSIIGGALLFVVSEILTGFRGLIQLASLGFWTFGVWVLFRYSLTCFYYILDGDNFRVVKAVGQKQSDVCNIPMRTGRFIKKVRKAKHRPPVRNSFNYCRNFAPAEKYVYFFEWDGENAEIIFEPSEEFAELMAAKLSSLAEAPDFREE